MSPLPGLGPDDEVAQYGRLSPAGANFRCVPRGHETAVSLIYGRVSVGRAVELILPFRGGRVREDDLVRYSTVGRLDQEGFSVHHRPMPHFYEHLEVEFPGSWDDDVCERFHECFTEAFGAPS